MRNSRLFEMILNILKFDVENFTQSRIQQTNNKLSDLNNPHTQIMALCYKILGLFVMEEDENKSILTEMIRKIFTVHMQTFPEISVFNVLSYQV